MRNEKAVELVIQYAWHFVGRWYKWGGDDPAGFDCSGLGGELLQAAGKLSLKTKLSAKQIWDLFSNKEIDAPIPGAFYIVEHNGYPIHIELCISETTSIGASGGGSKTLTEADAIRDNAFIKPRPIFRWGGNYQLHFFDPFKED